MSFVKISEIRLNTRTMEYSAQLDTVQDSGLDGDGTMWIPISHDAAEFIKRSSELATSGLCKAPGHEHFLYWV